MNTDEAKLLAQAIEAIAAVSTEDGSALSADLSAALFWGIGRLAREAQSNLEDDRGGYLHLKEAGQ